VRFKIREPGNTGKYCHQVYKVSPLGEERKGYISKEGKKERKGSDEDEQKRGGRGEEEREGEERRIS